MFKSKYSNQSMGYPKKVMPNAVQQDPLEASKMTQKVSR